MKASKEAACGVCLRKGEKHYLSRSIRQWSTEFMITGEFSPYRQRVHVKTPSIITDEGVQGQLRSALRYVLLCLYV